MMASRFTFRVIGDGYTLEETGSPSRAKRFMRPGCYLEVHCGNRVREVIDFWGLNKDLRPYLAAEKEYHRQKQEAAEQRNKRRR